ncbi:Fe2+-dicitrate sensor, membrane component [Caulobacter sp. AP07]|uniref:FecR family protein n=1 Tax=Caulobacter sp. AP07 TaxID=1144304 RepID=UPI000271ED4D|nr:FecR domain-containing protein [Caulobacter sp. AP07]EJL37547.1 Fe2+-dicitrate sensor, membrane component [Caulobacter sp. AP07]
MTSSDQQERLRQEASLWFARMRGPGADAHRDAFEAWRSVEANGQAYRRLVQRFEESAILGHSRLSTLRLTKARADRGPSPTAKIALALAACLVAGVGVATYVWRGQAQTRFTTTVGEIRTVALADGATLILDTDSAASAAIRDGRQAVRLERGRARIVAAKADLAVQAGKARFTAKDATFDLALAPQDQIDVTVLSGAPRLARGDRRLAVGPALPAGRLVRLGPDLTTRTVQPASRVEASWPSGLRAFDQSPLSEVAAVANRYNTRKIRFADPSLGSLRVSGAFRVTGAEGLAKALAAAFGLSVGTAPGGDIVLSRAAA